MAKLLRMVIVEMSSFYTGKNVFVTGADGFIGSHLTEQLLAGGASVTALSQYNSFGSIGWLDSLAQPSNGTLNIVCGDIRDGHFIRKIAEGHEVVFHLAALIGIPHSYVAPQSYVDVNVTGTLNILECCKSGIIGRLVHTSTSEVYGSAMYRPIKETHPLQAQSPYAASKIAADKIVESYHLSFDCNALTLRPFNTYGPRQSERAVIPTIIRQILDKKCDRLRMGSLSTIRDFNYVKDTVNAFLLAGSSNDLEMGGVYNAGSGASYSIKDLVDLIFSITGISKEILIDSNRVRPPGSEVIELIADAGLFEGLTGWSSKYDLEGGLTETIEWWQGFLEGGGARPSADYST